jgi:hypothetical protein
MQLIFAQTVKNMGDFSSLKVYDKISVTLIPSDESRIQIDQSESEVEIVNKNGELKIRMIPQKILQGSSTTVKVFYENLNDIQASQGSSISSAQIVESNSLNLTSNEGSKINLKTGDRKFKYKKSIQVELCSFLAMQPNKMWW